MSQNPLANLKPEDAQKVASGFGDMKQVFMSLGLMSSLDKFQEMTKFNAADPALKKFAAEIDKKTLNTRVELMTSLYEAIETPAVQTAINMFSGFVNLMINAATQITNTFTAASTLFGGVQESDGKVDSFAEAMAELATNAEYLDKAVEKFFDNLIPGWNDLQKTIENMGKIPVKQNEAVDQLTPGSTAPITIDPVIDLPGGTIGTGGGGHIRIG